MNALRRAGVDIACIALAIVSETVPLPARWIENDYANGLYARFERTFVPLANAAPLTIGDVMLVAIALGIVAYVIAAWRRSVDSRWLRASRLFLRVAAIAAIIVVWFNVAWALNYRRAPIVQRVAFDRARLTPSNVARFGTVVITGLNATAPLAHAEHLREAELEAKIATAFGPVVERLGDHYEVVVSRPKTTIFDRWFELAGIGGTWDPFAYETIVNAEFLPFERPFIIAHEWGHVAGFGDEGDANLIAALTTLRSSDPLIHYSGLFWAYGFLPDAQRREADLSPLVRADLNAARMRFLRHYDPRVYTLQWAMYDHYLRANRVARGVVSYSLFVQVLVATPLDASGLPLIRPTASSSQDAG